MKKITYVATGIVALSLFVACTAEESNTDTKTPEEVVVTDTVKTETPVEEEGVIQTGAEEKVPVDRTEMLSFWREFKQLIEFKDEAGLKSMFSADYDGILAGLYNQDYYREKIAASSHEDVRETKEIHKGAVVYEIMFTFPPEHPEEGQEESATAIYMQKNAEGNFEIFSVIEAG